MIFLFFLLGGLALWISYQDIVYGRIPNLAILVLGLLLPIYITYSNDSCLSHFQAGLVGICLSGTLLLLPKCHTIIGVGDLKLFCVACFFTNFHLLPFFMALSGVLGIILAFIFRIIAHRKTFPLGPALTGGLLATLLYRSL